MAHFCNRALDIHIQRDILRKKPVSGWISYVRYELFRGAYLGGLGWLILAILRKKPVSGWISYVRKPHTTGYLTSILRQKSAK